MSKETFDIAHAEKRYTEMMFENAELKRLVKDSRVNKWVFFVAGMFVGYVGLGVVYGLTGG